MPLTTTSLTAYVPLEPAASGYPPQPSSRVHFFGSQRDFMHRRMLPLSRLLPLLKADVGERTGGASRWSRSRAARARQAT